MQIINANVPLFLSTVENHHVIKDEILSAISSSGKYSVDKKEFKLQHTDWHLNREESRPYWSIIANNVFKHLEEVAAKFNVVNGNVVNYWVQQYGRGIRTEIVCFLLFIMLSYPTKQKQNLEFLKMSFAFLLKKEIF